MAEHSIRVWGRRTGFHARKVIWALEELGLDYELIDAGHGIAPTSEFTTRNPSALAPVIEDGGVVVWESNVIVRYLFAAHGRGEFAPAASLAERFAAEQWMDWNATTLWPAVRPIHHALGRGPPLPAQELASLSRAAERWFDVLEAQLARTAFLPGERFGLADIPAGLTVDRALRADIVGARPNLRRWIAQLTCRPAFPPE